MITILLTIAIILFLALQLEEKLRLPSPLGLILLSFVAHYAFSQVPVLTGDAEHFATLVIFLLPVLLISDSLEIKVADLKEHAWSLLYLAVFAIILSVLTARHRRLAVRRLCLIDRGGHRAVRHGAGNRSGVGGLHLLQVRTAACWPKARAC